MSDKVYMRTPSASKYLDIPESTLEKKRLDGSGPPFIRASARIVLYERLALDEWLASRVHTSTSDEVEAS